jgi:hypothetical protein
MRRSMRPHRHYPYFYVPGPEPRAQFANPNQATDTERAATYGSVIAGAGSDSAADRPLQPVVMRLMNPVHRGAQASSPGLDDSLDG